MKCQQLTAVLQNLALSSPTFNSCSNESGVLNSSFVPLMKFSAKNTCLRKCAKRYRPYKNPI